MSCKSSLHRSDTDHCMKISERELKPFTSLESFHSQCISQSPQCRASNSWVDHLDGIERYASSKYIMAQMIYIP